VDLRELVAEVADFVSASLPDQVRLTHRAEPGDYLVEGAPAKLEQVVANLILNARDALKDRGGEGEIAVTLERLEASRLEELPVPELVAAAGEPGRRRSADPETSPGAWICLKVLDNGPGIPAEVLDRLFEPFFSTKRGGLGTGLGLARVYGLVRQHGGHIDVHSSAQTGTRFSVYLPALGAEDPCSAETSRLSPGGRLQSECRDFRSSCQR
jgi:signal transduction histidine kinase